MLATGIWRWPRMTPGSVSTSRSRIVSFCFWAKYRTWLWANLMSSRSRLATWAIARSISWSVRRKLSGSQLSYLFDRSRTAASRRASTSARICSTVSRTLASAALMALASIPRLSQRAMRVSLLLPVMAGLVPAIHVLFLMSRSRGPRDRPGGDGLIRGARSRINLAAVAARSSGMTPAVSLYRLRIDRRAGAAADDQRRAAEEELVDAVLFAVLGELLEVEDLAHAQPHGRDHHPMPGLVCFRGLVRPHLDAPGVGADRRDLLVLAPVAVLELDPGRVAARIAAPDAFLEAAFHLPGPDDDEVAVPDVDILRLGAFVEFGVGNAFAILEPWHAAKAGDVEQHAAPDHLVLGMLDPEHVEALGVDELGVVSVIGLVLVKHMAERVPMGRALDAQIERVVGVADLVPVLASRDGVGAGRQHLVDRVETPAEQAGLRAVAVERNAEREDLAGADQLGRIGDVLGRDVIEGADLVVLAPAAPVRQLLGRLFDRGFSDLDVHRTISSILFVSRILGAILARRGPCVYGVEGMPARKEIINQILPRAARMRSGVTGISRMVFAPSGRSASLTALTTHPGAPAVPASPAPLAPSSESAVGDTTWPTSMSGISPAIGTR